MSYKIYVSIASYRDPFLQRTIDSLMCNADNMDSITVGCFIQAKEEEIHSLIPTNTYDGKVKYFITLAGYVFSVTECRNKCLYWLDDSYDYVLQVDAHSSFDPGWDTNLINTIKSTPSEKPLLSGALSSFGIRHDGTEIFNYTKLAKSFYFLNPDSHKAYLRTRDLCPNGTALDVEPGTNYARGWYLAGHFMFGPASYFRDIPQPEWVGFWGEEVINGVRAFTAGWDVFIPEDVLIYHLDENLTRTNRPRLWEDYPEGYFQKRDSTSNRVIDILLGVGPEEDLFYERSLEDFNKFLGYSLGELFDGWRREKNSPDFVLP